VNAFIDIVLSDESQQWHALTTSIVIHAP